MPFDRKNIPPINTRSEFFQDIMDKVPPRIVTYGSLGMLLIFALLALGMKIIKYPDVIISDVLVTSETPPIEVHCRTSGRISVLLKYDQQQVHAGDWVIVLNNSADFRQAIEVGKILGNVDSIKFWGTLDTLNLPEFTRLGDLQDAWSQFTKSVTGLRLFVAQKYQFKQSMINIARAENLEAIKAKLNNELALTRRASELAKIDYNRMVMLEKDSVVSKSDLEQKEAVMLASNNKVEDIQSSLINTQLQIEMLNKENTTLTNDKTDAWFNLRRDILQNYNKLLYDLSEWKSKYVLEAPVAGTLNFYEIRNTDEFLSNEQKVFTVAPVAITNYFAIAKLPVANAGKVHAGQKCLIKLNDYPYNEFGALRGKVQSISAAAKEGFYSVKIDLTNQLVTILHKQLYCKSQLSGEADIVTNDLTLFDRLFKSMINKNY